MSYIVCEADVGKDREIMLNLLKNNRTRENFSHEKRYDWIYQNNPDGKAIPWIIWEEKNKIPVGFTAVFPRRMLVNGREEICWNCGDFSIEPKYRSLGIALQLRKEAKKEVENGRVSFLYAHPNDRMKVVHLRAGHQQLGLMHRYSLPLRMNGYFLSKLNNELLANAIAAPLNQILYMSLMFHKKRLKSEAILSETPEFSDQHEKLFWELAKKYPVIGVRDKTYLKWKYLENPNFHYMLMSFFSDEKLIGYIVFSRSDFVVKIVEYVIFPEELMRDVLVTFLRKVKSTFSEVASVSVVTFETNPIVKILKELDFRHRSDATSAVITYTKPESKINPIIYDKDNWYLNVGDRDA